MVLTLLCACTNNTNNNDNEDNEDNSDTVTTQSREKTASELVSAAFEKIQTLDSLNCTLEGSIRVALQTLMEVNSTMLISCDMEKNGEYENSITTTENTTEQTVYATTQTPLTINFTTYTKDGWTYTDTGTEKYKTEVSSVDNDSMLGNMGFGEFDESDFKDATVSKKLGAYTIALTIDTSDTTSFFGKFTNELFSSVSKILPVEEANITINIDNSGYLKDIYISADSTGIYQSFDSSFSANIRMTFDKFNNVTLNFPDLSGYIINPNIQ